MTPEQVFDELRLVKSILDRVLPAARALHMATIERPGQKYTAADRARWRELGASPDLARHSKRSRARLIIRREGLPPQAFESIRKEM